MNIYTFNQKETSKHRKIDICSNIIFSFMSCVTKNDRQVSSSARSPVLLAEFFGCSGVIYSPAYKHTVIILL